MARGLLIKSVAIVVAIAISSSTLATQLSLAAEPEERFDETSDAAMPALQAGPLASGKIVMIDRAAARVEIEHRPIEDFYLQAATTIFKVADPGLLAGLAPGAKVRFKVERNGKGYVVTYIENSN